MTMEFDTEYDGELYESKVSIFPVYNDWDWGYEDEIYPSGKVIGWEIEVLDDTIPDQARQNLLDAASQWAWDSLK